MNIKIDDLLGAYHKLIMDPVHGGIPLQKHEVEVVDHPLFQRLRFICQNDILSLVFPGATHSRFLHSVGAMHVGGRMFMAMVENSLKYRNQPEQGLNHQTLEAISYFNRLVRCACLLHDSGHCSFSHQFNRTPAIQSLLQEQGRFERLWESSPIGLTFQAKPEQLEHEHYSIRVAFNILNDIDISRFGIAENDILALMDTTDIKPSSQFKEHAEALWPLIHLYGNNQESQPAQFELKLCHLLSSIVSGELDADRADYMLRDGFHSSVTIGGFNLDHLLSNLHFGWCSQTGWFGLAISEKGLGSLEDFVYSRHQMYRQVYAHKTAQGFDWLLRAAMEEVLKRDEILNYVDLCLKDTGKFKHLTDNYFWEAFRQYAEINPCSYSRCILDRIKMPFLATRVNLSKEEEQHYKTFLAQEHHQNVDDIVATSITARFTKIKHEFDDIKVLVSDHQSHNITLRLISQTSHFFDKFTDDRITHFYINPLITLSGSSADEIK